MDELWSIKRCFHDSYTSIMEVICNGPPSCVNKRSAILSCKYGEWRWRMYRSPWSPNSSWFEYGDFGSVYIMKYESRENQDGVHRIAFRNIPRQCISYITCQHSSFSYWRSKLDFILFCNLTCTLLCWNRNEELKYWYYLLRCWVLLSFLICIWLVI